MGQDFDEQLRAARKRAADRDPGSYARSVEYLASTRELSVTLGSGEQVRIAVELLEPFAGGSDPQLSSVEVTALGDLYCPALDDGLSTPGLLEGRFGSERWMKTLALRVSADRLRPPQRESAAASPPTHGGKTGSAR